MRRVAKQNHRPTGVIGFNCVPGGCGDTGATLARHWGALDFETVYARSQIDFEPRAQSVVATVWPSFDMVELRTPSVWLHGSVKISAVVRRWI